MLIGHVCFRTITAHRQTAAGVAVATNPDGREFDSHMTKRWLIALFIAALFSGKTFADCVPSPDTPASVIEYFQKFNKPLPEQFCAKEDAAPQASEEPSQEPPQAGPSKLECEMTLAATRNALATLGRLEKTLDAAAALKGQQLEGELKAAVEELEAKKAAFTLATNDLAQATRNLAGVLEKCAKGE